MEERDGRVNVNESQAAVRWPVFGTLGVWSWVRGLIRMSVNLIGYRIYPGALVEHSFRCVSAWCWSMSSSSSLSLWPCPLCYFPDAMN